MIDRYRQVFKDRYPSYRLFFERAPNTRYMLERQRYNGKRRKNDLKYKDEFVV